MSSSEICRYIRLDRVKPHGAFSWIVQGQRDEIDLNNSRQTLCEFPKEFVESPV
jgi:hypothetical protein